MNYTTFYAENPEKILLIGDVHGKIDMYGNILYKHFRNPNPPDKSIQIGDFGFKREYLWFEQSAWNNGKHKIVMGNHDYYPWLGKDFSYGRVSKFMHNGQRVMTVAGAISIDKDAIDENGKPWRTPGKDYFEEEEPNWVECNFIAMEYNDYKPDIMITHDCPIEIAEQMVRIKGPHNTQKLFSSMFGSHQPKEWYFGHYHQSWSAVYKGTMFRCLDELETVII